MAKKAMDPPISGFNLQVNS